MIDNIDQKLNSNKIVFSLIMATYNRKSEVENFILSLINQNFDLKKVELIIIDQNKLSFLSEIIKKYQTTLNIIHIKSEALGSSINRNIGIKAAQGDIIAFPDDDCEYYEDTLNNVFNFFRINRNTDTLLGQVFNRKESKKIIRNWPMEQKKVNSKNFFFLYTCITIFTKNKHILFSESLGPNTKFGAYEDADYILSLIKYKAHTSLYIPEIQVNHPELNTESMNIKKIITYGMGFGGFCRKNLSFNIILIYTLVLLFHLMKMIYSAITFDLQASTKRYHSISSRIKGLILFDQQHIIKK